MTVSTTLNRQTFDGDGSNKLFPFNFRFFENSHIFVYLTDADGSTVGKTLGTDYTLSGANAATGGQVSMIVAPAVGQTLEVRRVLPVVQPTSVRNQGAFFPALHEDAFDRLTMLIQQAFGEIEIVTGLPASTVLQALAKIEGDAGEVLFLDGQGGVNSKLSRALLAEIDKPLSSDDGAVAGWRCNYDLVGDGNKLVLFKFMSQGQRSQRAGFNGATGSKVDVVQIMDIVGGAQSYGGRHTLETNALFGFGGGGALAPDNTDNFVVADQSQFIADTDNGGTLASPRAAGFSASMYAALTGNAQYWANLTCNELNTEISSAKANAVAYHSVFQTASYLFQRAFQIHCIWGMSGLGGTVGNKYGILIGAQNGRHPFDSDSVFLKLQGSGNGIMQTMFDLTGNTFTDSILRSDNTVLSDGGLALTKAAAKVILGSQAVASNPGLQLRSSGTAAAYDVEYGAVGGNATTGNGVAQINAGGGVILGGSITRGSADGVPSLGGPTFRWSVVYAATGTINTSDLRLKNVIGELDHGLDMVELLKPIAYTWKEGDGQVSRQIVSYEEVEEDQVEEIEEDEKYVEIVDGKAVQKTRKVKTTKVLEDVLEVCDEQGNPVMVEYSHNERYVPLDPDGDAYLSREGEPIILKREIKGERVDTIRVTRKVKVQRPIWGDVVTYPEGDRPHWGFGAQSVKEVMDALGIEDFAGWTLADKKDPESRQGLRYEQFIPLLTKAIQELSVQNKTMGSLIGEMSSRLDALEKKS